MKIPKNLKKGEKLKTINIIKIKYYVCLIVLFRDTMESNKVEEAIPKFTEYFKLVVNKLLDHNQTRIRHLYAENLINLSEELEEFTLNVSKVNTHRVKLLQETILIHIIYQNLQLTFR